MVEDWTAINDHPWVPTSEAVSKKTFDNAVENIYVVITTPKLYHWTQNFFCFVYMYIL
jgi:hypothetical protein